MRRIALLLPLAVANGCVLPTSHPVPENAIHVGVLLPFTGEQAALGVPIGRALILARDSINDGGGAAGRPITLDIRDTHSGTERGNVAAFELLATQPIALLGPEEAELAVSLVGAEGAGNTLFVLPGASAPSASELSNLTQRIGPPLPTLGGAMAQEIVGDGATRLAVIHVGGPHATALAGLIGCEFTRDRTDTHTSLVLDVSDESRSVEVLQQLSPFSPDAIALVAFPRRGAVIVRDALAFLTEETRWYLSPSLQTDEFVRNVPPGVLDGSFGLSAALDVFESTPISNAYRDRFSDGLDDQVQGELVVTGYYYHDSLALIALAITAAVAAGDDHTNPVVLQSYLLSVSSPPGERVRPTTLAEGLALAADGVDIDYDGASGTLDMDDRGAVLESNLGTWTVVDGDTRGSSLPLATFRGFLDSPCATLAP